VTWHVGGEDAHYELPYMPECPECGTPLDEYGECSVCMEDEFYREQTEEAA
jgi:hypothetical protein